jgi:hypothetical protein
LSLLSCLDSWRRDTVGDTVEIGRDLAEHKWQQSHQANEGRDAACLFGCG